jgi:hypothetical protein
MNSESLLPTIISEVSFLRLRGHSNFCTDSCKVQVFQASCFVCGVEIFVALVYFNPLNAVFFFQQNNPELKYFHCLMQRICMPEWFVKTVSLPFYCTSVTVSA